MTQIKVQRVGSGLLPYACIAIGSEDLSFIDPGVEHLTIEKKTIEGGLLIKIRGSK